ncbi:DUF3592 domain-containing protein [Hymenobacter cavernae]|uniref:DUF3592 domain-containing protein n=1 Tax=Hymenobacter cavernae TaxID=2044852 RepID=A0ABQ1U2D3_9BACT|nr:DUF3592 domain-containing protein [Hymenobacter cavernae]GGF07916.1 hypothetical protein GCM10011383_18790 [Hymenobacter cavernae]
MNWFFTIWALVIIGMATRHIFKEKLRTKNLRLHGIRAQGVVIRNKFHLSRISVFRPVIQFQTQQGEVIEADDLHGWAMAIPRFSKGEKVTVLYEEGNPTNFELV